MALPVSAAGTPPVIWSGLIAYALPTPKPLRGHGGDDAHVGAPGEEEQHRRCDQHHAADGHDQLGGGAPCGPAATMLAAKLARENGVSIAAATTTGAPNP